MRLTHVLLRWYKSFNIGHGQSTSRRGGDSRPWNELDIKGAPDILLPFVEVPLDRDITTIVGGNETGKSHLLNAISKVLTGRGVPDNRPFSQTDLCHYAAVRSPNADVWPHIGITIETEESGELEELLGTANIPTRAQSGDREQFTLLLAPHNARVALLYIRGASDPIDLNQGQLDAIRGSLPKVEFIDSKAALPDQIWIRSVIQAYKGTYSPGKFYDPAVADLAARFMAELAPAQSQIDPQNLSALQKIQKELAAGQIDEAASAELVVLLLRDILGVTPATLEYLEKIPEDERGYIEGIVSEWNRLIEERLILSTYWQQDDMFNLRVSCKGRKLYFEITDRTKSVYTFRERSSGLRYFLSYYIQAKALEISARNRGSVVLMDEPDSFLSVLGQKNLLAVFESLVNPDQSGGCCQLIYTTHSPFLLNRNFPSRIKLLKKEDLDQGTQYVLESYVRHYEPVRSALGIELAQTLFLGSANLVLEGTSDQLLLAELSRLFHVGHGSIHSLDLNQIVLVSAESAPAVEKLLSVSQFGNEKLPPTVVLLDGDPQGVATRNSITGGARNKPKLIDPEYVILLNDVIDTARVIEDIVPSSIWIEGLRSYINRYCTIAVEHRGSELEAAYKEISAGERVGAATSEFFSSFEELGSYDKLGVMQECVERIRDAVRTDSNSPEVKILRERHDRLCHEIQRRIDDAIKTSERESWAQGCRRVVSEFLKIHGSSCRTIDLELHLEHLKKRAESFGHGAKAMLDAVSAIAEQVIKAKAARQTRIDGRAWEWIRDALNRIAEVPMNPVIPPKNDDHTGTNSD